MGEVNCLAIGLDVVNPLLVAHKYQRRTVNAKRNLCRYLKACRGLIDVDEFQYFRLGVSLVDHLVLQISVVAVRVEKFCLHHQVGEGDFCVVADGGFEGRVAGLLEVTARVQHIVAHCKVRRARNLLSIRQLHSKFTKHCVCRERGEHFVVNLRCEVVVFAVVVIIEVDMLVTDAGFEVYFLSDEVSVLGKCGDAFLCGLAVD